MTPAVDGRARLALGASQCIAAAASSTETNAF
jgi:hypothetical protein